MNKKYWIICAALIAAGAYVYTRGNTPTVPADLRDAPNDISTSESNDAKNKGWEIVPKNLAVEAPAPGSEKETFESCVAAAGATHDAELANYRKTLAAGQMTTKEYKDLVASAGDLQEISVLTCKDLFGKK